MFWLKTQKFRKKIGFYFLYNKNKLYYVGIGNVIKRLNDHDGNIKKGKLKSSKDLIEHINTFDSILQDLK